MPGTATRRGSRERRRPGGSCPQPGRGPGERHGARGRGPKRRGPGARAPAAGCGQLRRRPGADRAPGSGGGRAGGWRAGTEPSHGGQACVEQGLERVAGGGYPPPAPTPPDVPFGIRRFMTSAQASDAHRRSSRDPCRAALSWVPLGSCGSRRRSTRDHEGSWPRPVRGPHRLRAGGAA